MMTLNALIVGFSLLSPVAGVGVPVTPAPQVAADNISGSVHSIDWENKTFDVVVDRDDSTKQVSWNEKTSFMLDGETSTAKEVLVAQGKVNVSIGDDGMAASVSRTSE